MIGAAYATSLAGPFVADDHDAIVNNRSIRDWSNFSQVFARQRNMPLAGRPLVALTFALNYGVGGTDPTVYHVTNIAIHIACALLLFGIVRRTLRLPRLAGLYDEETADNLACASALLFAVHPLATEVVDYMTQRTEGLMALFALATLYAAIRAFTAARPIVWQAAAVAACCAGMLCKETMVVVPVLVFLYDWIFLGEPLARTFASRWRFYFALSLAWVALLEMIVPGPRAGSVGVTATSTPWNYLMNQAEIVAHYFRLVVWPHGLVMTYGPPRALGLVDVWPQAIVVCALVAATCVALVRLPAVGFLGAWIFITLAPTSTIIPITTEVGAERRMYLPLMAIATLLVVGVYGLEFVRRRVSAKAATAMLALTVATLGAVTIARHVDYASALALADSVVRSRPTDVAHGMKGSALSSLARDDEAIAELRLASRSDHRSTYNLGVALFNSRRLDDAIRELKRYVGEDPAGELVPAAFSAMGDAYAMQRNWQQALNQYRVALSMRPGDPTLTPRMVTAMNGKGLDLAKAGNYADAVVTFRQAIVLEPSDWSVRHNLAAALLDEGRPLEAETEARKAIGANPSDAGSYDLLGRALALQGKFEDAAAQMETAVRLAPDDQDFKDDVQKLRGLMRR